MSITRKARVEARRQRMFIRRTDPDEFFAEAGSVCGPCFSTASLTTEEPAIQRQAAFGNVLAPLGPVVIPLFLVMAMMSATVPGELLAGKAGVGWPVMCIVGIIWGSVTALQARATSFADDDTSTALVMFHWLSRAWVLVLGLGSAILSLFALFYPFVMRI